MPVNNALPWVKLREKSCVRPGYAFGLNQSSIEYICEIRNDLSDQWGSRLQPLTECLGGQLSSQQVTLAEAVAQWTGMLQRQANVPVSHQTRVFMRSGSGVTTSSVQTVLLVLPTVRSAATQRSLQWVIQVVNHLLFSVIEFDMHQSHVRILDDLRVFSETGVNIYSICLAADALGWPICSMLTQELMVLGQGHKARWLNSTLTDRASAISTAVAQSKVETARLLRQMGLPSAIHRRVATVDDAVAAAHMLGYPVVVKPADLNQGKGVAADLRDDQAVRQAFHAASGLSQQILVERWQAGHTHRLTVVNGILFRITKRLAGGVTGDGVHSVGELVERLQTEREQQARAQRKGRVLLTLDQEALGLLRQQGLSPEHIPVPGEYVRLRRRDNINAGGRNIHLGLDQVHPDNVRLAQDAAKALRLDIAGVDFITTDISRSWREVGGLICEVNAKPQLGANSHGHAYPELLRRLLPNGGHVPLDVIMCPEDLASHQSIIDRLGPWADGLGVSSRHGLWMAGAWRSLPFEQGYAAAASLLLRTDVQSAVCLMTPAELLQWGAPSNRLSSLRLAGTDRWRQAQRDTVRQVEAMLQAYVATGEGTL